MYRFIYLTIVLGISLAQTTGKISGVIIDKDTNEPIIGANVIVLSGMGGWGSSSDSDGSFFIINISVK